VKYVRSTIADLNVLISFFCFESTFQPYDFSLEKELYGQQVLDFDFSGDFFFVIVTIVANSGRLPDGFPYLLFLYGVVVMHFANVFIVDALEIKRLFFLLVIKDDLLQFFLLINFLQDLFRVDLKVLIANKCLLD
jgi:hypothetical protein